MWATTRDNRDCSLSELIHILNAPTGGIPTYPTDSCNEVCPGIYLGDAEAASNFNELRHRGITHVLNAAEGNDVGLNLIPSAAQDYERYKISYLGIPAIDLMSFPLQEHFNKAADFIQKALNSKGKVLVHCRQGISRSAALVIAFLMIHQGLCAQNATRQVRHGREIRPNDGFLDQLCDLNETLLLSRKAL